MDDSKKPWESKGMWMGVIALLALNLKFFGVLDIPEADQATLTDIVVAFIQNGAIIAAMVGRWVAQKKISL